MRKLPLVLLAAIAGTASAQPGASDPPPYPPPPEETQPPPPPQPYPQPVPQPLPPPGYAPGGLVPVQLTVDEHQLLQQGEISDGAHIGGAVAAVFVGFGIGQAVQGRYGETGWIFTVGEIASFTALVIGLSQALDNCFDNIDGNCDDGRGEGLMIGGLVGLLAFRVWEVVDAFGGPPKHNRKVRELRMRLGMPMPMYTHRVVPYVNKTRDNGATAGVVFRF